MSDPPPVLHVGSHRVRFEPPDLVCVSWEGAVMPAHITALYDAMETFAAGRPRLLMLHDLRRSGSLDRETRRLTIEDPRARLIAAHANVGGSFPLRVLATMLWKAMHAISGGHQARAGFFDSEAEARAWLLAERARLDAAHAPPAA
jgi:hypothetical protein